MTPEDRDMLVRIDENTSALKKVVFGNGRPGLASRMDRLEEQHAICSKQRETEQAQKPARSGNLIAALALLTAIASPFIANWLSK